MVAKTIHLRDFTESELMFDEEETREIFKFFFVADHQQIESNQMTTELRNMAQGMLVEAIDASYALGFVELAFKWGVRPCNPSIGMRKALQKLAKKALKHWFKHQKNKPLLDAPIYNIIRDRLASGFRSTFRIIVEARYSDKPRLVAFINYGAARG